MAPEPTVTFFITTARSGTQWTTKTIDTIYPDRFVTCHEPVGYAYDPKTTLRNPENLRKLLEKPRIRDHFAQVHDIIQTRSYVEVGFPAFALAPLLREEFGRRLRLVQLTRHPVRTAVSLMTHGWFDGNRTDIERAILITPEDPGARLAEYKSRWPSLTPFERGLYFWYQVHAFGLEQEAVSEAGTFARFRFEDMVSDTASQKSFCAFMGVPYKAAWKDVVTERVDRFHLRTSTRFDVRTFRKHPDIVELARVLGYDPFVFSNTELKGRYWAGRGSVVARGMRKILRAFDRLTGRA